MLGNSEQDVNFYTYRGMGGEAYQLFKRLRWLSSSRVENPLFEQYPHLAKIFDMWMGYLGTVPLVLISDQLQPEKIFNGVQCEYEEVLQECDRKPLRKEKLGEEIVDVAVFAGIAIGFPYDQERYAAQLAEVGRTVGATNAIAKRHHIDPLEHAERKIWDINRRNHMSELFQLRQPETQTFDQAMVDFERALQFLSNLRDGFPGRVLPPQQKEIGNGHHPIFIEPGSGVIFDVREALVSKENGDRWSLYPTEWQLVR